jgi:hypothetical protein
VEPIALGVLNVFIKAAVFLLKLVLLDPSSDDPKLSNPLPFSEEKSPPQSCDDVSSFPLSLLLKKDNGFRTCSFFQLEKMKK